MWKFCPQCSHKLESNWKFCVECGQQVNATVMPYVWPSPYQGPTWPYQPSGPFYIPPYTITWGSTSGGLNGGCAGSSISVQYDPSNFTM